jgi:hypothetical protein
MSYVFEIDDTTVWSPSLRIGELYVGLAECLAGLVQCDSGLSKLANDYYIVDVGGFGAFLESLLSERSSGHAIFDALTRGFLATSLVMLDRAAKPLRGVDQLTEDLARLKESVKISMPI